MKSGASRLCLRHSAVLLLLTTAMSLHAQDTTEGVSISPVRAGFLSSFSVPWRDLLKKPHDSERRNLLSGVSLGWTLAYPLIRTPYKPGTGKGV